VTRKKRDYVESKQTTLTVDLKWAFPTFGNFLFVFKMIHLSKCWFCCPQKRPLSKKFSISIPKPLNATCSTSLATMLNDVESCRNRVERRFNKLLIQHRSTNRSFSGVNNYVEMLSRHVDKTKIFIVQQLLTSFKKMNKDCIYPVLSIDSVASFEPLNDT